MATQQMKKSEAYLITTYEQNIKNYQEKRVEAIIH